MRNQQVTLAQYIGNKIRLAREAKGLEQKEMILLTTKKFSITNLKNIEKGEGNPKLSSIEIACKVLDLHISEVFPPKI
jgi:transcriptional regulator with XRE-family HTH domain